MKTRAGFVANSSSSTYVILGVKVTRSEVERLKVHKKIDSFWEHVFEGDSGLVFQYRGGFGDREGSYIIGVGEVQDQYENDLFTGEIEFDGAYALAKLKELGIEGEYPVKLYYGRVFN